ncbi:phytoene desaturase family protein [Tundrisphaera lichenicola]|uniref:phytoene desaturase family protein n=1 Tax=Tundrisphaera lichenicola TaxID=2029860 RepID=UPI003EB96BAA
MAASEEWDLIVIGGGLGGLATTAIARRIGLKVALLEAHNKLGGCAGYFSRGPYTFDVGATALMGLNSGEPIGDLLETIGLDFRAVQTSSYRVHLPDRIMEIGPEPEAFRNASSISFPGHEQARRLFWKLQEWVGTTLFNVASHVPRLPIRSSKDVAHNLKILGLGGLVAASSWVFTVRDVLKILGLDDDMPFRSLIAMLLQDTAQAGPETVPFANAAACLQAYRSGMSRPIGGMSALAEGIGRRFSEMGGDLRTGALVDRVEASEDGWFEVVTRRRQHLKTRQVAFNLPIDLAAKLLRRSSESALEASERKSRAAWSAVTAYMAIDRLVIPDKTPLFHQVLRSYDRPIHDGNNVLISLSPVEDPGYGPVDVRVATMSTHTRPDEWHDLEPAAYQAKKSDYRERFLGVLECAFPGASASLKHLEVATPRSFARYTRRNRGAVGGAPVSHRNSTFMAVDADVLGAGLWIVGDSVFPGQGTMATVLSAIRVVERMSGISWSDLTPSGREKLSNSRPSTVAPGSFPVQNGR